MHRANGPGCSYQRVSTTRTTTNKFRWLLEAGASGVLGGRAFWKEYFLQDARARSQFAATTALKRVADVNTLVRERATAWSARYGFTKELLSSIRATEGWHARYGSSLGSSGGTAPENEPPAMSTEPAPAEPEHTKAPLEGKFGSAPAHLLGASDCF